MNPEKLVAHRGDNTNHPENSYEGIKAALEAGARFVEFDIQMNADKSLVVIHDTDFKRTANNSTYLFEIDDEQTRSISIHEAHRFGQQHKPSYVSFLSEILELISHYPKAQGLIEVKRESLWYWGLDFFMQTLLAQLKGHEAQSTIISFGIDALEYTKAHSKLPIGMVFYDYQTCNLEIAKKIKPEYMICSHTILPSEALWKGDWKWMIYSINNIAGAEKILSRGDVDLIETDDITLLLGKG